jgi:Secretion system C-terminal sorting domain
MKSLYTFIFTLFLFANINAQCFPNQHSTTWYDNWTSCEPRTSPNVARGDGHWILYSLGHNYLLGTSHWWNGNEADATSNGFKKFVIDVSVDGINWEEIAIVDLPQANGENNYEGVEGPDLNKVPARYILLTAIENYGGSCYSLGEMKIGVELNTSTNDQNIDNYCVEVKAFPNPFQQSTNITIQSNCNSKSTIYIEDALGRSIATYRLDNRAEQSIEFNGRQLSPGVYIIKVQSGNAIVTKKLMKIE